MLKRVMGLAVALLAAWGSGCSPAPAPEEPPQWSMVKFVPQETQESAQGHEKKSAVSR